MVLQIAVSKAVKLIDSIVDAKSLRRLDHSLEHNAANGQ